MKRAPIIVPSMSPQRFKKVLAMKMANTARRPEIIQNERHKKITNVLSTGIFNSEDKIKDRSN